MKMGFNDFCPEMRRNKACWKVFWNGWNSTTFFSVPLSYRKQIHYVLDSHRCIWVEHGGGYRSCFDSSKKWRRDHWDPKKGESHASHEPQQTYCDGKEGKGSEDERIRRREGEGRERRNDWKKKKWSCVQLGLSRSNIAETKKKSVTQFCLPFVFVFFFYKNFIPVLPSSFPSSPFISFSFVIYVGLLNHVGYPKGSGLFIKVCSIETIFRNIKSM